MTCADSAVRAAGRAPPWQAKDNHASVEINFEGETLANATWKLYVMPRENQRLQRGGQ